MPYKFDTDKKVVGYDNDRRRKLTDDEREQIKKLYGTISQRKLAKMFGVSRRLIIFIGCPENYTKNLKNRIDKGGSKQYYDRKKQRQYMKKHRDYKKKLDSEYKLKQGGKRMIYKQKCKVCDEWFFNNHGLRKNCFKCSPKTR